MSGTEHDEVVAAVRAWFWVHDDAERVGTDEYLLTRNPDWFQHRLTLHWFRPQRPWPEVAAEVLERARGLGGPALVWHHGLDGLADVEQHLRERLGATVDETLDVFALDLSAPLPDADPPVAVELRTVEDVSSLRDADEVGAEVFGDAPLPADRLPLEADLAVRDLRIGRAARFVAVQHGRPVGTGGVTSRGTAAGLWGGAVVEDARGRGVYRALLRARLRWAREQSMTLALVRGRVQTSGPILRRAGFTVHGQERTYLVPLDR